MSQSPLHWVRRVEILRHCSNQHQQSQFRDEDHSSLMLLLLQRDESVPRPALSHFLFVPLSRGRLTHILQLFHHQESLDLPPSASPPLCLSMFSFFIGDMSWPMTRSNVPTPLLAARLQRRGDVDQFCSSMHSPTSRCTRSFCMNNIKYYNTRPSKQCKSLIDAPILSINQYKLVLLVWSGTGLVKGLYACIYWKKINGDANQPTDRPTNRANIEQSAFSKFRQ